MTDTLEIALQASGLEQANVAHKLRLLSDNGPNCVSGDLGNMCAEGNWVARDYVSSYKWLHIAAVGGSRRSAENLRVVAARMAPQQIRQAQRLARQWLSAQQIQNRH